MQWCHASSCWALSRAGRGAADRDVLQGTSVQNEYAAEVSHAQTLTAVNQLVALLDGVLVVGAARLHQAVYTDAEAAAVCCCGRTWTSPLTTRPCTTPSASLAQSSPARLPLMPLVNPRGMDLCTLRPRRELTWPLRRSAASGSCSKENVRGSYQWLQDRAGPGPAGFLKALLVDGASASHVLQQQSQQHLVQQEWRRQ